MLKPSKTTMSVIVVVAIVLVVWLARSPMQHGGSGAAMVNVVVPELSEQAQAGEELFNAACANCHGRNAAGQDGVAPPLVHKIYEPSHHADGSFQRAAKYGVRAHHWRFGNMPPVDGISRKDVSKIIVFVRELQRANGIN